MQGRKKWTRLFGNIMIVTLLLIIAFFSCPSIAEAESTPRLNEAQNILNQSLSPQQQLQVANYLQGEGANSDLMNVRPSTVLSTRRGIQAFTTDGTYYYYLSQVSQVGTAAYDLRVTRILYKADGTYDSDYMVLRGFGHGTNLDCAVYKGVTYLWTGSDYSSSKKATTTISSFIYRPYTTLWKHGSTRYKIKMKGSRSYASNVYPAVSADGKTLCVRYTKNKKQYFQFYSIKKGGKISTKIKKAVCLPATIADFQGFDIRGNYIYTIEGSVAMEELISQKLTSYYRDTVIRVYNMGSKRLVARAIYGAPTMTHREAEGIQVDHMGRIVINLTSHYLNLFSCANLYLVK